MKSIKILKKSWPDSELYVLGSGPSMNYLKPSFFEDKFTVGINRIWKFFPCDYVVIHHGDLGQEIIDARPKLAVSKHDCGYLDKPENKDLYNYKGEYYQYNHKDQGLMEIDYSVLDSEDSLVTGGTTAIDAISFAYFLGAKNIILCGIDGGTINGEVNLSGYHDYKKPGWFDYQVRTANRTNLIVKEFADILRKKGIGVYSLNPFINFSLEGNKYENIEL